MVFRFPRRYALSVLLLVLHCAPISSAIADTAEEPFLPRFVPCFEKGLPGGGMGILVIGHEFRGGDVCEPVTVTLTWRNYYDNRDGYTHYDLRLSNRFSGEFWYRTDREEFAIVADPAHWVGYDKLLSFNAFGQDCARQEEGMCVDLRKFDSDQVHAQRTGGVYLGSLTYGYPEVTRSGEKVPVTFFASTPVFEFRNTRHYWRPDDGLVKINNPALVKFDYKALVKAATKDGVYTTKVLYDLNNDVDDIPSFHKGELEIKLDFDKICNGDNRSDMGQCEQINKLLSDLKWTLELRNLYRDLLPDSPDQATLESRVLERLRLNHPEMSKEDSDWLLENSGVTDPTTLEIFVPDLCDRCAAKPLCSWQSEAIRVHEKTHVAYLLANPAKRDRLNTESGSAPAKQLGLDQAEITSEMEYRAYNEQAKYLYELIEQQLNNTTGCPFSAEFYDTLNQLGNAIDQTIGLAGPQPKPQPDSLFPWPK